MTLREQYNGDYNAYLEAKTENEIKWNGIRVNIDKEDIPSFNKNKALIAKEIKYIASNFDEIGIKQQVYTDLDSSEIDKVLNQGLKKPNSINIGFVYNGKCDFFIELCYTSNILTKVFGDHLLYVESYFKDGKVYTRRSSLSG